MKLAPVLKFPHFKSSYLIKFDLWLNFGFSFIASPEVNSGSTTDFFVFKNLKSLSSSIKLGIYQSYFKLKQKSSLVYFRGPHECGDADHLAIFKIYRSPNVFGISIFIFALLFSNLSLALPTLGKNDSPIVLKAKKVDGDQINQVVEATGNVEISKGTSQLLTEFLIYDKKSKKFKAKSKLKAKDLEVGYLTASRGEISDDFNKGEFFDGKIFFNDGSYLFADKINRDSELITILKNPEFSICPNEEIVRDDSIAGKTRDFASITSSKSIIDRGSGVIKSRNSVFRLYGVPVFYTPFSRITLDSKKRKTGFLGIGYTRNNSFGIGFRTPLFVDLAPNKDLTITPTFFAQNGQAMLSNQFRHFAKYGKYSTTLEIANNKTASAANLTSIGTSDQKLRWRIESEGDFDFTRDHSLDFKINNMSDRNYLKNYSFTGLNRFVPYVYSKAEFNYKKGRNYYFINATKIQELENEKAEKHEQIVLPAAEYYFETKPFFSKERISITTNLTNIYRVEGMGYQRASVVPAFKLPFNLNGNLFELDGKAEGDFYSLQKVSAGNGIVENTSGYKSTLTNQKTEMAFNWHLPMIKKTNSKIITIEPVANLVASSFSRTNSLTPNEDSNASELSVSNLFVTNRISGYDRMEAGQRVNYGLKSAYFDKYGQFDLTIGQSYRLKNKSQDIDIRGFAYNNRSNYVGQASYKAKKYFSLNYSFQLDQSSLRNDVNQITSSFDYNSLSLSSNYILIRRTPQILQKREQLSFFAGFKLGSEWKITLNSNIDLISNRQLQRGIIFERFGCCTIFSFSVNESKPVAVSKPIRSFNLNFSFKNL